MKKLLPFLILIAALSVSGSAAFYSVYGLGKLFAGAALQVMIMAGSLEFAKLVIATSLHRYWTVMNKLMRAYLIFAATLLIGITSAGIYGFLSSAYQVTAAQDAITTKEIGIIELRKNRFDEQRSELMSEKNQIIENITSLRTSISNPGQVQYIDKKTGQVVSTTSSASRKSLETQLNDATTRRDLISQKIETVTDSLATLDVAIVTAQSASETSSELGPLKYVAGLTGKPMDVVVNWFLFLLIFVFDPLAVTLILLANFSFEYVYGAHAWDVVSKKSSSPPPITDVPVETEPITAPPDDDLIVVNTPVEEPIIVQQEPIIPVSEEPTVLVSDVSPDVIRQIQESMPWINKKPVSPPTGSIPPIPHLSETQKRNMTHQEVEEWYKKNSV